MNLTLQGQDLVGLDHDAQLQHQLGGALQEDLQQAQHADVGTLEHQAPVVMALLVVPPPAALHPQVQGVDIPEDRGREDRRVSGVNRGVMRRVQGFQDIQTLVHRSGFRGRNYKDAFIRVITNTPSVIFI